MPPSHAQNPWTPQGGPHETPCTPNVEELRAFTAWQKQQHQLNPAAPPPTWREFQTMQEILAEYSPVQPCLQPTRPEPRNSAIYPQPPTFAPSQTLSIPIDPEILVDERLNAMQRDMQDMRSEIARLKASAAEMADHEQSEDETPRCSKTKRKRANMYILCKKNAKLTDDQLTVKECLRVSLI